MRKLIPYALALGMATSAFAGEIHDKVDAINEWIVTRGSCYTLNTEQEECYAVLLPTLSRLTGNELRIDDGATANRVLVSLPWYDMSLENRKTGETEECDVRCSELVDLAFKALPNPEK